MNKVRGGTTNSSEGPLCETCRHFTKVRGRENQDIRYCHHFEGHLPFAVVECSSYYEKNKMGLQEMSEIAWNVTTDKRTGGVGFHDPKKTQRLINDGKLDALESVRFGDERTY